VDIRWDFDGASVEFFPLAACLHRGRDFGRDFTMAWILT
jgi:hypothetical protein